MENLAIVIMSNGTETVPIIGTDKYVSVFDDSVKIKVKDAEQMQKVINTAMQYLSKRGFSEINERMLQYA